MTTTTAPEILSHAQLETRADDKAMEAARLGDRKRFGQLWAEYAALHAQRPLTFVRTLEKRMKIA